MFKIQNAHYESTTLLPQTEVRTGNHSNIWRVSLRNVTARRNEEW